ncbi:type II toxin-antitoxin system VapC family toxin [Azospirillum halopraeferens]|uniref:type II toxin-antitoxin system VapC family toxin n=1 Tax=Azospirillum halopraeferens TaxID=34010 RepID=UPI0004254C73|nr:type II toxin-antitoxin system VapC family toxin [Azospirillum halopraeferens]
MVIDTSAIIAILKGEPEAPLLLAKIATADVCRISAATLVEIGIVARRDTTGAVEHAVQTLLHDYAIRVEAVDERHARIALGAFSRYGKGTGSPARLNFGDVFSYALAQEKGEPLLFKGNDFARTDVPAA